METVINFLLPVLIVICGGIAGYFVRMNLKKSEQIAYGVFFACHVLAVFFPLQILQVGKFYSAVELYGKNYIVVQMPDIGAALINICVSMILIWGLVYVIGAFIDIKKELLP